MTSPQRRVDEGEWEPIDDQHCEWVEKQWMAVTPAEEKWGTRAGSTLPLVVQIEDGPKTLAGKHADAHQAVWNICGVMFAKRPSLRERHSFMSHSVFNYDDGMVQIWFPLLGIPVDDYEHVCRTIVLNGSQADVNVVERGVRLPTKQALVGHYSPTRTPLLRLRLYTMPLSFVNGVAPRDILHMKKSPAADFHVAIVDKTDWVLVPGLDWIPEPGETAVWTIFKNAEELYASVVNSSRIDDTPGAAHILACAFIVVNTQYGGDRSTLAVRSSGDDGALIWRKFPIQYEGETATHPSRWRSPFFDQFTDRSICIDDARTGRRVVNWGERLMCLSFKKFAGFTMMGPRPGEKYSALIGGPLIDGVPQVVSSVLDEENGDVYRYSHTMYINEYSGLRMNRAEAAVSTTPEYLGPLLALIYVDICSEDMASFSALVRFLAACVQQPCVPICRLLALYSGQQGVGKNNLLNNFGEQLIGAPHYARIRTNELVGRFNDVLEGKLVVQCDEFNPEDKQHLQRIKDIVTDTKSKTEEKFMKARERTAMASYMVTTNGYIPLEPNDRRTLIIQCTDRFSAWSRDDYGNYHTAAADIYRDRMPSFGAWLMTVPVDLNRLRTEYLPSEAWDRCREASLPSSIQLFITGVRAMHTVSGDDVSYEADTQWAIKAPSKLWNRVFNQGDPKARHLFQQLGVQQQGSSVIVEPWASVQAKVKALLPQWGQGPARAMPMAPSEPPTEHWPFDEKIRFYAERAAALMTFRLSGDELIHPRHHGHSPGRTGKKKARVVDD